jgi:hypothetical protein
VLFEKFFFKGASQTAWQVSIENPVIWFDEKDEDTDFDFSIVVDPLENTAESLAELAPMIHRASELDVEVMDNLDQDARSRPLQSSRREARSMLSSLGRVVECCH